MTGLEKLERVRQMVAEWMGPDDEVAFFDGLEDAIIGVASQYTQPPLVVYDERAIIDHFIDEEHMTEEEALDWYGYNVADLWVGDGTPLILKRVDQP